MNLHFSRLPLFALWQKCQRVVLTRTTAALAALFCCSVGLVFWHFSRLSRELIENSALQSAPEYSKVLTETRSFYTSDVAGRARGHGVDVTADYKAKTGSIPIPTTFTLELGERLSTNNRGLKVRLYSMLPFPQRRKTGGPHDQYERDALDFLTRHPDKPFVRFENYQGRDSIRYSTADIMRPACVNCHNTRPDSPKRNWKVGDVRGVLEVVKPLDKVVAQTNQGLQGTFLLMSMLGVLSLAALSSMIGSLRRHSAELESRVDERTHDLSEANTLLQANVQEREAAQAQLQIAKTEAEEANRSKSAFLATMSHEIRTPMNAVIGMSGLLLSTPLSAEQREFAGLIEHSGDALLGIINDILDFSKIEAGRMELECHALDLCDCIESAFDLVVMRAGEKSIELVHDFNPCETGESEAITPVPPAILGDVTRLRQVITNLLTNAVKFTEAGEIVLSVEAKGLPVLESGAERYQLHFSVRDTGIGIPLERMDRLFKSFSQVDASTTRKYGGSGLGLTISKRLCEMMGGQMWAESEGAGKGATFHFSIEAEAVEMPARRHRQGGVQPGLESKRVLIVDDNAANRRILALQVESWGMRSRATASPLEALVWIRQGDPFDVAILDFQMPEMDGLRLAQEIRRHRQSGQLPLVMCTSIGRRLGEDDGVDWAAYLTKPVKASQMFDALADLFASDSSDPGAAPREAQPALDEQTASRAPLRILLAEDNAVNQKVALRLLSQMGYRADVAGNGLEALQSVERQRYDVVLMDVQMPEMDGLEAARRICARFARGQRPRIIAMTANAMQGDREMCLEAGMDDYLSKPVRPAELAAALSRCPSLLVPAAPQADAVPQADAADAVPAAPQSDAAPQTDALTAATSAKDAVKSEEESTEDPVLDAATLANFRQAMGEVLPELIEMFVADSQVLVETICEAVVNSDADALRRAAHTLKSNSASFGALKLAAMCRELEEIGLFPTPQASATHAVAIADERDRVVKALGQA